MKGRARLIGRCIEGAIVISIALLAIQQGIHLRTWAYTASGEQGIRFHGDIDHAWEIGSDVVTIARDGVMPGRPIPVGKLLRSYLLLYDVAMVENPDGDYDVDYPPARLLIMSFWAWSHTDPQGRPAGAPEDIDGPLLNVNTGFELAGAIFAFALVRLVLGREGFKHPDWPALAAGLLLWFDPALILNAHVWPQWEAWVIPFFLLAAYLGLIRQWLAAGICLGFGSMFKGQLLLTMPFFVLWPLFQGRWKAVLQLVLGILFGGMLYVWPWMLMTGRAKVFFFIALPSVVATMWFIPRRWRTEWFFGSLAIWVLAAGFFLGGSFGWWYVGFEYGTRHHLAMTMGPVENLASICADHFNWQLTDDALRIHSKMLHADWTIPIRAVLVAIYAIMLVLCSMAMAVQDARKSRRVLLALATPWILLFAFMPQMHDRYLVWGAALTALAAGISLGSTLLHFVVTFLAFLPMGFNLIYANRLRPDFSQWQRFFLAACDSCGEVTVLVALMFLCLAFVPKKHFWKPNIPQ